MKSFLLNSTNHEKSGVIWNMFGSLLYAFQSVIFLIVLTKTVGLVASGIFTIAYANANLFLNIGKYGMRNYQVSDVKREYSFSVYKYSRFITVFIMFAVSILYTIYTAITNQYSSEKTWIIIWMCIFKLPDALEDVYYGELQKQGRLDVAAKALTFRIVISILIFIVVAVISHNLLFTIIFTTLFSIGILCISLKWLNPLFDEAESKWAVPEIIKLLRNCFSLFAGAFLSYYIGNAPKYAIDTQLSDELQACYGFIAMPVFVIGLLNGFIFNPLLYHISQLWNQGKFKEFRAKIVRQIFIVIGITIFCMVAAYFCGIPVLSIMYSTDLSPYRLELLILLLGGGCLSISGVLYNTITIIRFQKALLVGYGIVSILAFSLSNIIVAKYQMMGAAVLYLALMIILCISFTISLFIGFKRK